MGDRNRIEIKEKENNYTNYRNIKRNIKISQRFTNYLVGRSLCMCCPERGGLNDYSFAGTRSKNFGRYGSHKNFF